MEEARKVQMENQKEEVTREKKKGQDKGTVEGAVFMRGYPRLVKGDRLKIC